jgi:hypothetical protein
MTEQIENMLTYPRCSVLRFDGKQFLLEPCATISNVSVKGHVIEEGLETVLFHWGNQLLPEPCLHMLGYSGFILPEQDLLAVDELGRTHMLELKKDVARADSTIQLVSYLARRPEDHTIWIRRTIAETLWYGESSSACRLAGLVSRTALKTLRTDKSRKVTGTRISHAEGLDAKLNRLAQLAAIRTGMDLRADAFRRIAESLLDQQFGGTWTGPLKEPSAVLGQVAQARLSSNWKLGRTNPSVVGWVIAPDVREALAAAQPFIDQGLQIRCVSVDVREVVPGLEWIINVDVDQNQIQSWPAANLLAQMMQQVMEQHLQSHPLSTERLFLRLRPEMARLDGKEAAWLGWHAAGGAYLILRDFTDHIKWDLYNHWWTEGPALEVRAPIMRLCDDLRRKHPNPWPWLPDQPDAVCNNELIEAAVRLMNDYWMGLTDLGAFEVDDWAYLMPPK